jgi:hypothetical protein
MLHTDRLLSSPLAMSLVLSPDIIKLETDALLLEIVEINLLLAWLKKYIFLS